MLLIAWTALWMSLPTYAAEPVLNLKWEGKSEKISLKELRALPLQEGKVLNPGMKHTIEYSAVKIEDVLKAKSVSTAGEGNLSFICADGYAPVLPTKKAVELGLLLAYRDRSAPKGQDWNKFKFKGKLQTAAPFYVLTPTSAGYAQFPWPFMVTGIEVQK